MGREKIKYKAIFCDLDGTLLFDHKTITEYTKRVIKEYTLRGGIFIINTGRMDMSSREFAEELGTINQPISVISLQGSMIMDNNGKIIHRAMIDNETAVKIIKIMESRGVYVQSYDDDGVFVKELDEISLNYKQICNANLKIVGCVSEHLEKTKLDSFKILSVIPANEAEAYMKEFDELKIEGVDHFMASKTYFEFVSKNAGKEKGMKTACDMLGLSLDEVMAFGDNGNDVEMIRQAGFGVAVDNAREEAKAVASYVCESNEEDGVAKTIEKFCLL